MYLIIFPKYLKIYLKMYPLKSDMAFAEDKKTDKAEALLHKKTGAHKGAPQGVFMKNHT